MALYKTIADWASTVIKGVGPNSQSLWADYLVAGTSIKGGATAPTFAQFRNNIWLYSFAGTGGVSDEAMFQIHLLHDLKAGTTPTIHIHWSRNIAAGPYTPGTANVKWQLEYTIAKGYGAGVFGVTTTLSTVQTADAQYTHHITSDDDMPLTAFSSQIEPDSVVLCRIFRDPSDPADTFSHPAFLLHVDCHYEKGQIGTTERNRPFTSAGFGA